MSLATDALIRIFTTSEYYDLLDNNKINEQALLQACKHQDKQFPHDKLYGFIMSLYGRKLAKMLDDVLLYEDEKTQKAIKYSSKKCYQLILDAERDDSGVIHLDQAMHLAAMNNLDNTINGFCNKYAITKSRLIKLLDSCVIQLKGWVGYFKSQHQKENSRVIIKLWLTHFFEYSEKEKLEFNDEFFERFIAVETAQSQLVVKIFKYYTSIEYPHFKTMFDDYAVHRLSLVKLLLILHKGLELSSQQSVTLNFSQAAEKKLFSAIANKPSMQWVLCMDTRSDSVRSAIEKDKCHETFGVAGFFNFALEYHSQQQVCRQAPLIVEPEFKVIEKESSKLFDKIVHFFYQGYAYNNKSASASFETFNLLGLLSYIFAITKQFLTSYRDLQKPLSCDLDFQLDELDVISINSIVDKAESLLTTIGLTENFAETIVFCGHKATTANNPFESTLACGACGGNSGLVNAVFVAKVLNSPLIRHKLKQKAIDIPASTRFLAAGHDTTTCQVQIISNSNDTPKIQEKISQLNDWLKQLSAQIIEKNSKLYPDNNAKTDRPYHWAETLPELGLANNAMLIVGPREITKDLQLDGKAFLHCYSIKNDNNFVNLKAIMNGPMVVAHWINMQYYASSVAPQLYGAGSKSNHNLIPGVGVIIGKYGDLQTGLPLQSVFNREQRLHMPLKLHVYIHAPQHAIDAIVNENDYLQNLVEGGWISIDSLFSRA